MKNILLLIIFVLTQSLAYGQVFESASRQATLLELYSSEGCSSCPPADEWVREFLKPSNLWKDYVPVVFHVDYWDRLGWRDPYASRQYTERQEDYAREWRSSNLFTPSVVINGKSWRQWRGIKTLPIYNHEVGVLKAEKMSSGKWQVSFLPKEQKSIQYEAHIALLGFDIKSKILRGENAGRTLNHDFVVLDYQQKKIDGVVTIDLAQEDPRAAKLGVAVWVSKVGSPIPFQTTGGYL